MKKWIVSLGLIFSISFIGTKLVDAEENYDIATIIQSGVISDEDNKIVEEIIAFEKATNIISNTNVLETEITNDEPNISSRALLIDPILDNWRIGTNIVFNSGYPGTAMYMRHAETINGTPKTHTSNNNGWAKNVVFDNGIMGDVYNQVYSWVRNGTKGSKLATSSYAFNTGDKYYALHLVNYSYTFTRQSNGGVSISGTITDRYDFEWSKYDNIKAGFANNYAVLATRAGTIKPFNIVIKASK